MRIQIVMRLVGQLLFIFSAFTLIPFVYGLINQNLYFSFLYTSLLALVLAGWLYRNGIKSQNFSLRDGFLVVSMIWILTSILGSLPFIFSGILTNPLSALFESTSGITATGASIIADVDTIPKAFILWRGVLHWIGGMGIIVLILSFLKNLGADAAHFFNAEASVPKPGVVMPRIRSMASKLWRLYLVFTVACFLMLWAGGIEPFIALNYAFSIIATGGFAPTTAGGFDYSASNYITGVFVFFMILAGGNFSVYYNALHKGIKSIFSDFETLMYLLVLAIGVISVFLFLWYFSPTKSLVTLFREATFMLVSLQTGSGFAIADYNLWPAASQIILFVYSFFGGCSGSTTGGLKIIRIIILMKSSIMHLRKSIHPDMVQLVRVNGKPMPDKWIQMTQQFFFLFVAIYILSVIGMACTGMETSDALQIVTAFLANVGIAFGNFGPTSSFADLHDFAKLVAIFDMLLGRLELFTILVMFHPQFWEGYFIKSSKPKQYQVIWNQGRKRRG